VGAHSFRSVYAWLRARMLPACATRSWPRLNHLHLGREYPKCWTQKNNEYRKCFSLSAHTAYAHTSYLQCFLPFAFHSQRPVRFSAARPFLSALELPKRKRATLEPAAAARQDAGHVGFIHLGHTRLCKVFGGAAHYGSVTAYQKPFFNVVYDDGHNEVMTGNQLAPLLRVDDAAFADPRRWAFDWTIMTMLKVQGFLPQIASYVRSFGLSLPAQWLDLMPDDVDTSTPSNGHRSSLFANGDASSHQRA